VEPREAIYTLDGTHTEETPWSRFLHLAGHQFATYLDFSDSFKSYSDTSIELQYAAPVTNRGDAFGCEEIPKWR
jgi:hypothetical protein